MNTFVQYFMKYNGFEILILWACSPLVIVIEYDSLTVLMNVDVVTSIFQC